MNKQTIRHYLMIAMTGMFCWLTTGVVSAHVGATKTGWNDLAPELRAEIAALKATVATLKAGQPRVETIHWKTGNRWRPYLLRAEPVLKSAASTPLAG